MLTYIHNGEAEPGTPLYPTPVIRNIHPDGISAAPEKISGCFREGCEEMQTRTKQIYLRIHTPADIGTTPFSCNVHSLMSRYQ